MDNTNLHQPVLLAETMRLLAPQPGESYFDGTAGYGGHVASIIETIGVNGRVVLVDRDRQAIRALHEQLGDRAELKQANFLEAAQQLVDDGSLFDLILLDLGVSSPQLDNANRGFSFKRTAPLDMRMDMSQDQTAYEVVNGYSVERLADVIVRYGEEPRARAIARAIVERRPINTTTELAKIVRAVVRHKGDIDSATRTFQAIRIEVNAELVSLEAALPYLMRLLTPGGRMAVISFHSLEDRIVKTFMNTESKDCICPPRQPICTCKHEASLVKLTPRPISGRTYDANNPRARSAQLRAAAKIKTKTKGGIV